MSKETIKNLIKITGILNIIGAVFAIIILFTAVAVAVSSTTNGSDTLTSVSAANSATVVLKLIFTLVGTVTFVLGILLIVNLKKVDQKVTAGVLSLIAGVFSWILIPVSLVLWIIAAVQLLKMKLNVSENNNDIVF